MQERAEVDTVLEELREEYKVVVWGAEALTEKFEVLEEVRSPPVGCAGVD